MKAKPTIKARTTDVRVRAQAELKEFGARHDRRPMMLELYRHAEAQQRKLRKNRKAKTGVKKSSVNNLRLIHELEVHQVELEMQNDALQEARDGMEALLAKYADLYEFAPVGYLTMDSNGQINEANLTAAVLLGVGRGELINRRLLSLVAPASQSIVRSFLENIFATSTKQFCEAALLRPDGKLLWGGFHGANAISVSGSPRLCRVVVSDITSLKAVEDEVRVSEVRYRRLFETAHDGVLLIDPGTRKITDANPFMTKLLGYPHDRLVGKELFEIGLLKDETASQEMFRKLKRDHEVRYEDLPLESQGGRHQEVEVVANLYQENGHAVIQCNIRDITERKLAEEVLRRSEALFCSLVEQAPFGVYVVNSLFQLQQVNRKAKPVFRHIHPLIGRDFSEVHHLLWEKRVSDSIVALFRHTLKTGEPYQSPDYPVRRRNAAVKEIYEWQIQRVTLPGGEHGVVCFFNDITARKEAEATQRRVAVLAASNRKLELEIVRRRAGEDALKKSEQHQVQLLEQSHLLQEQLRQVSRLILQAQEEERKRISRELHDVVAQSLAGINVRLTTLKKQAALGKKDLGRNISRTQRLVEKSVDAVHRFALELRPPALDDLGLIPALHSFLKSFLARTGVRARLTAFAEVEKLDNASRTVLFRVAQEALTNVAKHARASRVELKIQKGKDYISMSIHDDGKSFQVNQAMQVNARKRLGLLGMRERIEMIGGKLLVESAPGEGTTVTTQIPLRKARAGGGGGADGVR